MKPAPEHSAPGLFLVDPDERWALEINGAVLFYRRLSLEAAAAIERQQTVFLDDPADGGPRTVLPAAALEAARAAYALVGWQGVSHPVSGRPVAFGPGAAGRLPAGVRRSLVAAAMAVAPGPPAPLDKPHGEES